MTMIKNDAIGALQQDRETRETRPEGKRRGISRPKKNLVMR